MYLQLLVVHWMNSHEDLEGDIYVLYIYESPLLSVNTKYLYR